MGGEDAVLVSAWLESTFSVAPAHAISSRKVAQSVCLYCRLDIGDKCRVKG